MFTGIIESMATVESVENQGTNKVFWVRSPLSDSFRVDQSVAHNGVCLTVEEILPGKHRVTAVAETLAKTNLAHVQAGDQLNLERSMVLNGRVDGHLVQGHVDATGTLLKIETQNGSWLITIQFDPFFATLMIEKGSICLNGISLTVFNVGRDQFQVAIIPYTYDHTNISKLKPGDTVNLEFDVIGKYIQRSIDLRLEHLQTR